MQPTRRILAISLAAVSLAPAVTPTVARAASAEDLDRQSHEALEALYRSHPSAEKLSHEAKGVLIFPNIVKAGLVFGGSYGEGELLEHGHVPATSTR
jgi:lipid-binding SYLF domain-containing protein